MKKLPTIAATLLIALAVSTYFLGKNLQNPTLQPAPTAAFSEKPPTSKSLPASPDRPQLSRPDPDHLAQIPPHPDAASFGSDPTNAANEAQQLFRLFDFYRESFGSFPSGEGNAQFMHALQGANPSQLPIFPQNHPRLNSAGEILDFWGNPFFFHQISSDHIEIRSSGPDGEIFTADDLIAPVGKEK